MIAALQDVADVVAILIAEAREFQQLRESENRIKRRAKLMAHAR